MAPRWTAVLICGCLLSFCSGSGQTSDIDDCDDKQRHKSHIELCHNRSLPSSSDAEICQCKDDNQGFIVNDLLIARSSKEHRCDSFQADGFLGVQCLRGKVDSVTQLDAAVFDVLEKVSGKNQIKKYTEVQHISFTATGEGGEKEEDSSAFVSFQKICKPVRPADTKVVEMCTKGKTTGHSVFLVLNRSRVPSAASRCRCKLTPSKALDVKALDIRLQHFASHVCQPGVSLKMSVDGQTVKDLKCEGLYAYYSLEKLHSGEEEVVLELTVRADAFPTALWMQVEERLEDGGNTVIVSCEDIAPVDVDGGDENGEEQEEDKGMGLGGILGIIFAGIIVSGIVVAVVIICIRKRRRNHADSTSKEIKGDIAYSSVNMYSEPNQPKSSFQEPYDFPDEDPDSPPAPPSAPPPPLSAPPPVTPPPDPLAVNLLPKPDRTFDFSGPIYTEPDVVRQNENESEDYDLLQRDKDSLQWKSEGGPKGRNSARGNSKKGNDKQEPAANYDHIEAKKMIATMTYDLLMLLLLL